MLYEKDLTVFLSNLYKNVVLKDRVFIQFEHIESITCACALLNRIPVNGLFLIVKPTMSTMVSEVQPSNTTVQPGHNGVRSAAQ